MHNTDSVLACLHTSYLILVYLWSLSFKRSNRYNAYRLMVVCAIYIDTLLLENRKKNSLDLDTV